MTANQKEWEIGLSAWIIQDGNYLDFEVGQFAEFALEFHSKNFRAGRPESKTVKPLGGAMYAINGQVIFLASDVWVIDFGIGAFQKSAPPPNLSIGDFVTAEVYLGIDPYFYFEWLYCRVGMPPLIYSWKVNSILQETAPFVESRDDSGREIHVRDMTKQGFKSLQITDAWEDDDGYGEYILNCGLLAVEPKYHSVTAS